MLYSTILLFVEHFFITGLFIFLLWKRKYKSKFDWLVMAVLVGAYVAFLYLTGRWYIYGYYFKYLVLAAYGMALLRSLWLGRELPLWRQKLRSEWMVTVFVVFFAMIFILTSLWAYRGHRFNGDALNLTFPLKNGTYYIVEGGDSPLINQYHRFPPVPYKFSVEITKLNQSGRRAEGIAPDALNEFAIFGEPVYSPGNGIITAVVDSLPDEAGAYEDTSFANILGNRITIRQADTVLILGYLQRGSTTVQEGDTVQQGEILGRVGCSGETGEPMLHIRAYREVDYPPWEGKGLPLMFDGQFLVRNTKVDIP